MDYSGEYFSNIYLLTYCRYILFYGGVCVRCVPTNLQVPNISKPDLERKGRYWINELHIRSLCREPTLLFHSDAKL